MVEEAKFYAWLDGELSPEEAERVGAAVAADPELSRLANEHRAMTAGLRSAFASVDEQPVPDRLLAAVQDREVEIVDLGQARAARRRLPPIWAQAAALAATLAVGVFTGSLLGSGGSGPITADGGPFVASADLETALNTRLAGTPQTKGAQIRLTFRNKTGAICRTFEDHQASGLACRDGQEWRIRSLFQGPERSATDFRMASGANPQLMEAVDASIDGAPFDAAQEREAMERGWRK
ncbi:MAG TPA: hypothetical protein VFH89_13465 [Sphingomicrobium sp.]|nr:hypothetical protein [Sphingomicrobium sp.]